MINILQPVKANIMYKYYFIIVLNIILISKSFAQTMGISTYSGIIYNHSQRLYQPLGLLNDNYHKNFIYGVDVNYEKDRIGYKLGYYSTKFTNVLNFDGSPDLYFSNKNFIGSIAAHIVYLAFSNSVIKKNNYKLNLVFGIDMSYTDRNSYDGKHYIRDSLYFEDNSYYIDLITYTHTIRDRTFGFDFSIENHFLITNSISAFISLTGRLGFAQAFTLYYVHSFTGIDDGHSTIPQDSMVANKGDFIGLKIGMKYNFITF